MTAQPDSLTSLKYLLEDVDPLRKKKLEQFLSLEMQTALSNTPLTTTNPFEQMLTLEEQLSQVHYSWFLPFLDPFPRHDKAYLIAALDEHAMKQLNQFYKLKYHKITLSLFAKRFALNTLFQNLISNQPAFIPSEYLPDNRLNALLSMPKLDLVALIDYLGLYDLSREINRVVQANQIQTIQETLTKTQIQFLREITKHKETLTFTLLGLNKWDGDLHNLKKVLHHRGLNRLAKALFGSHPSLFWHITHRLDTGRAKILNSLCHDIKNEKAKATLIHQVMHLISFFKKPSELGTS